MLEIIPFFRNIKTGKRFPYENDPNHLEFKFVTETLQAHLNEYNLVETIHSRIHLADEESGLLYIDIADSAKNIFRIIHIFEKNPLYINHPEYGDAYLCFKIVTTFR